MRDEQFITRQMLHFCYICADARECETEETCVECWTAKDMILEEPQDLTTEELLILYAL
ncbi:hypothetical protein [Paenibacillus mucilaginosus]|uniref:Uncharacterized protein n=2 Tax=Paenibacillus mucilaginosus TaxID=61624 RepID=I0BFK8_9BACL|nr:hypothetical protein [Paenibacillus mucilaginosus]AEI40288.1 hypothetical protein KNP414_01726 [Paenibacillus mucilaginosus KNP414]AFH61155.1 hypothetical protein B2K_10545 [Paenibacillus mucilaginosus K02]MCG7213351.1 hypothetical protein [Paenibacillus mucilaginosus]WDM29498.1 hypothetical protein KCX80_10225 [Paenibacillus mucilaginosus]